mmetsp:Transcript_14821/g.42708  ORF Transcript_14821/g.42708 Transcript_14821/m.42708 type:complete len:355 (+) Transcript_14821:1122-2186(+)
MLSLSSAGILTEQICKSPCPRGHLYRKITQDNGKSMRMHFIRPGKVHRVDPPDQPKLLSRFDDLRLYLRLLAPLILLPHLGLVLGRKVAGNIENLANLLGALALDQHRHGEAREVQQGLDVHKVGRRHQLEQQDLLHLDVVGVPLLDHLLDLAGFERGGYRRHLLHVGVVRAVLNDLGQDGSLDVGEGDLGPAAAAVLLVVVVVLIVDGGFDEGGHFGHRNWYLKEVSLLADLFSGKGGQRSVRYRYDGTVQNRRYMKKSQHTRGTAGEVEIHFNMKRTVDTAPVPMVTTNEDRSTLDTEQMARSVGGPALYLPLHARPRPAINFGQRLWALACSRDYVSVHSAHPQTRQRPPK